MKSNHVRSKDSIIMDRRSVPVVRSSKRDGHMPMPMRLHMLQQLVDNCRQSNLCHLSQATRIRMDADSNDFYHV